MTSTHTTTLADARLWRQRLLILRGLLVSALALLFIVLWLQQLSPIPVITVLLTLTMLWSPSLLLTLTRRRPYQERWLLFELLLDVLFFCLFLQQVGGSGNPLAFYLLLPTLLAALALPLLPSSMVALAAVAGYSNGVFWQPAVHHQALQAVSHAVSNSHLIGMWLVFCLLAVSLTALGHALRQAQQQQARQQHTALTLLLQRERMYQVAGQLANQAHELNTPLNSLLLIADDLIEQGDVEQQADLSQLRALVLRMAAIIRQPQETLPETSALSVLCHDLARTLSHLAPTLNVTWHGPADPLLSPASDWQRVLANLGYNACDAHAKRLDIRCERTTSGWLLQVADDGPQHQHHGSPDKADKQTGGLGLGLPLIDTTLASHQASLSFLQDRHWTLARIEIPAHDADKARVNEKT